MLIRGAIALSMLLASVAAPAVLIAAPTAKPIAASAKLPAAAAPVGNVPVLGSDYFLIDNPDHETGKSVSVVEVFGYSCPHCAHFQSYIDAWKKKQSADVKFSYLPAAFGGVWEAFARAYYTADAMGVLQKSHNGIFDAVHVQHRPITNISDIAALYADYGVDQNVFASTMVSFPISAKVDAARAQAQRWGIDSTPTMVVAGKYRVMVTVAGREEGLLRNVDWFVAKERAARKRH